MRLTQTVSTSDDLPRLRRPARARAGLLAAGGLLVAGVLAVIAGQRPAEASPPAPISIVAPPPYDGPTPIPELSPEPPTDADEPTAIEPPAAAEPDPRLQPATKAAAAILRLEQKVRDSLTHTRYEHHTRIDTKAGIYVWDCSAMVGWFLRKSAPVARKAMNKGRPVARDYYRQIARAPTKRPKQGWRRLPHIEDVRPGDMFAWIRPPGFPSRNTGHVGFALEPARPVPEIPGAYTLRILDATSLPHQDDTRAREEGGGIGHGTILFLTDEHGRGTAYGWFGRRSRGVIATDIVFGRVSR